MSWSVSASGGLMECHSAIDEQVNVANAGDQQLEWERANIALHSLLSSLSPAAARYYINGTGSFYGPIQLTVSAVYDPTNGG